MHIKVLPLFRASFGRALESKFLLLLLKLLHGDRFINEVGQVFLREAESDRGPWNYTGNLCLPLFDVV